MSPWRPSPSQRRWSLVVGSVYVASLVTLLAAQSSRPAFEVASVKRNVAGGGVVRRQSAEPGGRFVAKHQTLANLIQFAYGVGEPQLVGGPEWISTAYFDINAKAADETSESQIRLMLQSPLEDRFRLVVRKEQREMPVQEVTLNRADRRLGPRLIQVSSLDECKNATAELPRLDTPPGAVAGWSMQCGSLSSILAQMIFSHFRTGTIDNTNLTGTWLVSVYYAPEGAGFRAGQNADANLPSFGTAVQEQLGLKLRATRGLVDVLTIESVQQPTED